MVKTRNTIRTLLSKKSCLRIMEAHSPLSALITENTVANLPGGGIVEYDGFWSSSLTDSTLIGKPDIEVYDIRSRLNNIDGIFDVTSKPVIIDADTGGKTEHFELHVRTMSRLGVSAVIIEDKTGLKKNSLFGNEVEQLQEDIGLFCEKITKGKASQLNDDFMIIARIESLILEAGMQDALTRARAYIAAGADGIMIHSRKKDGIEIFEFARKFRDEFPYIPLVCVPTSYNHIAFDDLRDAGYNIIIYANHMLRASYNAMKKVAESVLVNGRTMEIENECLSIEGILELVPGTR